MKKFLSALICVVCIANTATARDPRRDWFNDFRRNETRGPLTKTPDHMSSTPIGEMPRPKPCECRTPSNPSRVEFRPTGPTRTYCGPVDPNPLRVDVRNIGAVPIGKQFQITNPSYTTPDGVTHFSTGSGIILYGR